MVADAVMDGVAFPLVLIAIVVSFALFEWYRWALSLPTLPWVFTFVAIIVAAICAFWIRRTLKRIKNLKLGRDGERAVGQFLDDLRRKGAFVFHDVPGEGFNIDHVIIHASGIYAIETKTLSKPDRGDARLIFDGVTVRNGAFEPDRNPVIQARAAAKRLAQLLQESTGRSFPVRPVVLYPGWYIESTVEARSSDVWVLSARALPSFIECSEVQLPSPDLNLCNFHLSRYVRTS